MKNLAAKYSFLLGPAIGTVIFLALLWSAERILPPVIAQTLAAVLGSCAIFAACHLQSRRLRREECEREAALLARRDLPGLRNRLTQPTAATDSADRRLLEVSREILDTQRNTVLLTDKIAIGGAQVSFFLGTLDRHIKQHIEQAVQISAKARDVAGTTSQIAAFSHHAASSADQTRVSTESGQHAVHESLTKMQQVNNAVSNTATAIRDLCQQTETISSITGVINGVAEQTNLLALNAAIEAARAGEHGRGFAVVADEVRSLASRTAKATGEIDQMLRRIATTTEKSLSTMQVLEGESVAMLEVLQSVDTTLEKIGSQAVEAASHSSHIVQSLDAQVTDIHAIASAAESMREAMATQGNSAQKAADDVIGLAERAEQIAALYVDYRLDTRHEVILDAAKNAAAAVAAGFERALAAGEITMEDLFDRNYVPIPNTNPTKFHTRFDAFTDRVLPSIQEPILEANAEIVYAGAVDNNGYFPTHNRRFCQALTGDYVKDLAGNRTKRKFSDRTGQRCGQHSGPALLQTYSRDTGEVMHDLSVPIMVRGKHWGGFRIGYRAG